MLGFVTRRRYEADLAAAKAETNRQRARAEAAEDTARAETAARRTITRQHAELDEKYADVCIVNECLTRDLTKARERIAQYGVRRTVSDVLEEHDVHRKALADALGDQKRHLNWDQLIAEAGRLHELTSGWMAQCKAAEKRADGLQRRLDDAVGLAPTGIQDSAPWQPGYVDKSKAKEASAS